tara:strand:+ start:3380 stop:4705 length:1326 start_codon:yes stop_codon:yes gene_type:complete
MSEQIVKNLFDDKVKYSEKYAYLHGVKHFDLERKHLFYGRINKKGNAVYIDPSNLKSLSNDKNVQFSADFVSDAFSDMQAYIASRGRYIENNSRYVNLKAHKSRWGRSLDYQYSRHINKVYSNFVQDYLNRDRRHEKIINFKDFTKEFLRYATRIAHDFPITKTGFILSNRCSPFASGLMIEIGRERHTPGTDVALKYLSDPNFQFFSNTAKKFGFMVDKNAPWRIVFNIASGYEDLKQTNSALLGAQKYMDAYGCNFDNVFETYFIESHLHDMEEIKNLLLSFYETFYSQFPSYETLAWPRVGRAKDSGGQCMAIPVKSERRDRDPPPQVLGIKEQVDEYWFRVLLKLRLAETKTHHTSESLPGLIREMTNIKRLMGPNAASNYINNLTKGFFETKFIKKGKYWHGQAGSQYEHRKADAQENIIDPARVDYALVGTKGKK